MVAHKRRPAEKVGSLSPEFMKKLNTKPKPLFQQEEKADASSEDSSRQNDTDKPFFYQDPTNNSYFEELQVSELLHQLPYKDRTTLTESEHMEFMTYLRPVLKEDVFPELHNGWKFLQSHIYSKNLVF